MRYVLTSSLTGLTDFDRSSRRSCVRSLHILSSANPSEQWKPSPRMLSIYVEAPRITHQLMCHNSARASTWAQLLSFGWPTPVLAYSAEFLTDGVIAVLMTLLLRANRSEYARYAPLNEEHTVADTVTGRNRLYQNWYDSCGLRGARSDISGSGYFYTQHQQHDMVISNHFVVICPLLTALFQSAFVHCSL
jgi:hypothetical protein